MPNVTQGLTCENCPHYWDEKYCRAHPPAVVGGQFQFGFPAMVRDDLCGEHPVLKARLRVLEEQFFIAEMQAWAQSHKVLVPGGPMVKP